MHQHLGDYGDHEWLCGRLHCPRSGPPAGRPSRNYSALLEWVSATGCSRVAIHFDVDTIDSNEILLGPGPEPNGPTSAEVRRIIADIDGAVDVVGPTIAEFIPRQVMHLQQLLSGFPLIGGAGSLTPDATAAGS